MQGKDVVLGLLNNKELTGYEIKEIFESQLKYFFDGSFGMIYPLLRKLENKVLLKKDEYYKRINQIRMFTRLLVRVKKNFIIIWHQKQQMKFISQIF